ncbi:MAG: S-adenosylmethionine:tRNA ribosyltransferase-isomerase [Cyclobacteriaceae bacterium]|nr:S-adenosylmethionine:tRNA ribosyltransferase-isomerase [Cyclobacteriaceae bacterium]
MDIASVRKISDFSYTLPDEKIARKPVEPRDSSLLLLYNEGSASHTVFRNLPDQLPFGSSLVFNNTKVIPARMYFQRLSGAVIEVFLLKPLAPFKPTERAMGAEEMCIWQCLIGNKKKWKAGESVYLELENIKIEAKWSDRDRDHIEFNFPPGFTFAELVDKAGHMPIPPYFNRASIAEDREWYQTVYSRVEGAVAAPTAGLHFTNSVLDDLKKQGFQRIDLTLHVSAGTFQPVKSEDYTMHPMHNEELIFSRESIEALSQIKGPVIPVGTTSMRSLESLYWFGVERIMNPNAIFDIEQDRPYRQTRKMPEAKDVFAFLANEMQEQKVEFLHGQTRIFIYPGYEFKVCDAIITNFHQPNSTLLLLIAAFIGSDWKKVYQYALDNSFRFLSYGDSSLLFRNRAL